MLWNLIYEFYVKYIFGGLLWVGDTRYRYHGDFFFDQTNLSNTASTGEYSITFLGKSWLIGNYFSLIATIITMIIILIVIGHFIKKTFNLFGRII